MSDNKFYAAFDGDGALTASYQTAAGDTIPDGAIELDEATWADIYEYQGMRRYVDGRIVEYEPPYVEPVVVIPAVTLWERMTDDEAEQVNAAMATQPFRTRKIFETANTFRSDHELWPLLLQVATTLFGEVRASELLAA